MVDDLLSFYATNILGLYARRFINHKYAFTLLPTFKLSSTITVYDF